MLRLMPPRAIAMLAHDEDGSVGLWRQRILLQVRRLTLPLPLLRRMQREIIAIAGSGTPTGVLIVIEAGARMLTEEVRQAQRVMIEEIAALPTVRIAPVILGDDVPSAMNRTAGRVLAMGSPRVRRFTALPPAAAWLASELEAMGASVPVPDLLAAMAQLRELPETPPLS
jgi:hypothetical protein